MTIKELVDLLNSISDKESKITISPRHDTIEEVYSFEYQFNPEKRLILRGR